MWKKVLLAYHPWGHTGGAAQSFPKSGRLIIQNYTLMQLVRTAYGVRIAGPRGGGGGPFGGGPPPRGAAGGGRGNFQASAVQLATLINFLAQQLGRPVIDKTSLSGLFDFKLESTPGSEQAPGPFGPEVPGGPQGGAPPPADSSGPFTALQEQLGLRLESTKGPVDVVVIDSAQKPSEN